MRSFFSKVLSVFIVFLVFLSVMTVKITAENDDSSLSDVDETSETVQNSDDTETKQENVVLDETGKYTDESETTDSVETHNEDTESETDTNTDGETSVEQSDTQTVLDQQDSLETPEDEENDAVYYAHCRYGTVAVGTGSGIEQNGGETSETLTEQARQPGGEDVAYKCRLQPDICRGYFSLGPAAYKHGQQDRKADSLA